MLAPMRAEMRSRQESYDSPFLDGGVVGNQERQEDSSDRGHRRTEHKGHNIEVKDARSGFKESDDSPAISSLDRPIEINKKPAGISTISSPVAGMASPFPKASPSKMTRSLAWESEPEDPEIEYDLEAEVEVEEKTSSGPMVAIFVGGTILTGTLGFLVYRGLSQN